MTPKTTTDGFTLIETLVAIGILMIAIAGPFYAASRSLTAAQIARDQLTASYLAQEGIEYVRAMRDDEYLAAYLANGTNTSTASWTNFTTANDSASITPCETSACTLDPWNPMGAGAGKSLMPCAGGACGPLYLANGVYRQDSGILGAQKTPFTRTVQGTLSASGSELKIVSTVSWDSHGTAYTTSVTDYLTAWQ